MFCLEAWNEKMRAQAGEGRTRKGNAATLLQMASNAGERGRVVTPASRKE